MGSTAGCIDLHAPKELRKDLKQELGILRKGHRADGKSADEARFLAVDDAIADRRQQIEDILKELRKAVPPAAETKKPPKKAEPKSQVKEPVKEAEPIEKALSATEILDKLTKAYKNTIGGYLKLLTDRVNKKYADFERKVIEDNAELFDQLRTLPEDANLYDALSIMVQMDVPKNSLQAQFLELLQEIHKTQKSILQNVKFEIDDKAEVSAFIHGVDNQKVILDERGSISIESYVHEILHAVTSEFIRENPTHQITKSLRKLFLEVKTQAKSQGLTQDDHYGLKSPQEFIAEAFSRPSFQEYLNSIESRQNKGQTYWQDFLNLLKKLFNYNKGSVLEDVMNITSGILKEQVGDEAKAEAEVSEAVEPGDTVADRILGEGETHDPADLKSQKYIKTINKVKVFFRKGKNAKSLFQLVVDFKNNILKNIPTRFTESEVKLVQTLAEFTTNFSNRANSILNMQEEKYLEFFDSTPLNFLAPNGTVNPEVLNAMALVGFDWLATRAAGTLYNDDDTIRKALNLPKGSPVTPQARRLMSRLGMAQNGLDADLGKQVLKILNLETIDDAPDGLQEALEISLGQHTLGILEAMNYIERNDVIADNKEGGITKLRTNVREGIRDDADLDNFFYYPKSKKEQEGLSRASYFRVKENQTENFEDPIDKRVRAIIDVRGKAQDAINEILYGEKSKDGYRRKPFTEKDIKALSKKANDPISETQIKNLLKNMNRPYVPNGHAMNMFMLLDLPSMGRVLGWRTELDEMKDERLGARGYNKGIFREYAHVENYIGENQELGLGKDDEIYTPANFWKNQRMGMQGDINPQNSKLHRALFSMKGWESTFEKGTNSAEEAMFIHAIGLSLGVEILKEGGIAKATQETLKKLQSDDIAPAIELLRELIREGQLTDDINPKAMRELQKKNPKIGEILATAVEAGGENFYSLKGMIEYARFMEADGKFTTDMYIEIDGAANGPTFMRLQLAMQGAATNVLLQLALLRNSGVVFGEQATELGDQLGDGKNHDPYQAIGLRWAKNIAIIESKLEKQYAETKSKGTLLQLRRIKAAKNLLGNFTITDGVVDKTLRKLSKDPTMQTVYGSGSAAQIEALTVNVLLETAIYDKLKEAANNNDREALNKLNESLDILMGIKIKIPDNIKNIKAALLNYQFKTKHINMLKANIKKNVGEALSTAVDEVYSDVRESRKPLTSAVAIMTANYNVAYQLALDKLAARIGEDGVVTKKDLKEIEDELAHLFPAVETPFGNQMSLANKDLERKYDKKDNKLIKTRFKGKTVKELRSYPYTLKGLEAPGVAPLVLMIQSLDAAVANMAIGGKHAVLNVHDGFLVGLKDAVVFGQLLNKHFYEVNKNYSVARAISNSLNANTPNLEEWAKANNIPKSKLYESLEKELDRMGVKHFVENDEGKKVRVKDPKTIIDHFTSESGRVADETEVTKNEILDVVRTIIQYYVPGGEYVTNNTGDTVLGEDINKIDERSSVLVSAVVEETLNNEKFGSKPGDQLSTDPQDYQPTQEINGGNAVQTYDKIKNKGTVQVSQSHDSYLKNLLNDIVSDMMNPIDLLLKTDDSIETQGAYIDNKILISSQMNPGPGILAHGIRMSTGETYSHELVHAILSAGLKKYTAARQHARRLYNKTLEHLENKYGDEAYRVFLNDPNIDVNDKANEFDVAEAKERYEYVFGNPTVTEKSYHDHATTVNVTHKESAYLDEFMALGLTNENFLKELRQIETPLQSEEFPGKNLQQTLLRTFYKIMEFIRGRIFKQITGENVAEDMKHLAMRISDIDSKAKNKAMHGVLAVEGITADINEKANNFIKGTVRKLPVTKMANELRVLERVQNMDNISGKAIRTLKAKWQGTEYGILKQSIDEIIGAKKAFEPFYRILNARARILDQAREEISEVWRKITTKVFKGRELSVDQKTAITKVGLRTDMTSLLGNYSMDEIKEMLLDHRKLQAEIDRLNGKLLKDKKLKRLAHFYRKSAVSLAFFMVHGRGLRHTPMLNAHLIARLRGTSKSGNVAEVDANRIEPIIDQLATLNALGFTSVQHRAAVAELIKEDAASVRGVLNMHQGLKNEALSELFNNNPAKMIKGYTKQILDPNKEHRVAPMKDKEKLEALGYIQKPGAIQRDPADASKHQKLYLYVREGGRANDYMATGYSYTGNRPKGVDTYDMTQNIIDDLQFIADLEQEQRNKEGWMFSDTDVEFDSDKNYMIPKVNDLGEITGYRYMMAESTKDAVMNQNNEFDLILSGMAGQIIDKKATAHINPQVVQALKDFYDDDYTDNPRAYVEISPFSTDPRMRDIYYMMTDQSKHDVESVWGDNKMFVRKDIIDLVFGYRRYSIVEAFNKNRKDMHFFEKAIVEGLKFSLGNKALTTAKTIEDLMTELTKLGKNSIIVKSVHVTLGNMVSNLFYLKMRGMSTRDIFKYTSEATKGAIKYQSDNFELKELQIALENKLDIGLSEAQIKRKIGQLENEIALNPVTKLIEAGMMPAIVDDVDTSNTLSPYPGRIEKMTDKYTSKLHPSIRNVGKVFFMTEDTQAYKVANNAVKLTDFVARYALYQEYTKGKKQMKHEDAIQATLREFVNFNVPTHRAIEYGNQIGLVWFSKYKMRILRVMYDTIKDKPFEALQSFMLANAFDASNIFESIPGITSDTLQAFNNPLSVFLDSIGEILTVNATEHVSDAITK